MYTFIYKCDNYGIPFVHIMIILYSIHSGNPAIYGKRQKTTITVVIWDKSSRLLINHYDTPPSDQQVIMELSVKFWAQYHIV